MVWSLLVVLLVLVIVGLPRAGLHSYGYAPSGVLTVVLVVLLVLMLMGRV